MKQSIYLFVLLFQHLFLFSQVEKSFPINIDGDTIYSTTLIPTEDTKIGALIIAGSGPTNRDGLNPLGVKFPSYKLLAESLTQNGLLTIRFDKRGIAESGKALKDPGSITMERYVKDVEEIIVAMKKEYPFIKEWVVIGHSEGATIGAGAVLNQPVSKFISLSGTCADLLSIIEEQLKAQMAPDRHHTFMVPMDSLKAGHTVKKYPIILASVFAPSIQPYLISSRNYSTEKLVAQIDFPVLILQGDSDIQVKVKDAECLKEAQPKAELVIIPQMNHILKKFSGDMAETLKNYADAEGALHPDLMKHILAFIKQQ